MQKILLLFCCFWLHNLTAQNDWNPFPINQLAYFNKGVANPMDMYWADSATTTASGQTMRIVGQKYYRDLVGNCGDTIYQQMRSHTPPPDNQNMLSAIPKPDSFIFDNGFLHYKRGGVADSFPYLANIGDAWTQQIIQPFADSILWTCDSIVWGNHLGFDDSIKYFTAQPMQNGTTQTPKQIKLAKNLGFISFIPLSYNWDSLNVPIWENIGFVHNTAGHFGFTSSQLNWERKVCSTNDVFAYYYHVWNRNFRVHIVDSVTYFHETSDSLIYHIQTDKYIADYGSFSTQTTFDTVAIDKHFPLPFYQNPNNALSYGAYTQADDWVYIKYAEYSQNTGARELYFNDYLNSMYYDSSDCSEQFSLNYVEISEANYKENLGRVWAKTGSLASPGFTNINELNLIGYRTCGDTMGNTNRDSLMNMAMRWTGVETVTTSPVFRLYPNPATNLVQVEIQAASANDSSMVEIYNLSGSLLRTDKLSIGNLHQLDVSGLPPGLYILRLQTGQISAQSLLIKH